MALATGEWITPPEVYRIAGEIKAVANQVESLYSTANGVGVELNGTWFGNAKNIFDAHFNGFPNEFIAYANELRSMAAQVLAIKVWIPDIEV
jgi:uncharacterized protein YukE